MIGILLLTALAGGVGGAARFLVDSAVARANRTSVPLGIVVVNVTACLLLGLVTGYALTRTGTGDLTAIAGVGLLGGYSTFSTASVEGLRLLRQRRPIAALIHSGGMLLLSVGASTLGIVLGALLA